MDNFTLGDDKSVIDSILLVKKYAIEMSSNFIAAIDHYKKYASEIELKINFESEKLEEVLRNKLKLSEEEIELKQHQNIYDHLLHATDLDDKNSNVEIIEATRNSSISMMTKYFLNLEVNLLENNIWELSFFRNVKQIIVFHYDIDSKKFSLCSMTPSHPRFLEISSFLEKNQDISGCLYMINRWFSGEK